MNFDLDNGMAVLERTPSVLRALLEGLPRDWVEGNEGPFTELYDLDADPYELENRAAEADFAATREALAARLAQVEIGLAKRRRAPARRDLAAAALEALAHLPAQGLAVGVRQVGAQRAAVAGDVRDAAPG